MSDFKDLTTFAEMPDEFTRDILPLIENAVDEYRQCRAYIRRALDYYGEDAFKNPANYFYVECNIKKANLPESLKLKLFAVAAIMRKENCNE